MVDWKRLCDEWASLPPEMQSKIIETFIKKQQKDPEKLKGFIEARVHVKNLLEKAFPSLLIQLGITRVPVTLEEFETPQFHVKDPVIYQGKKMEVTEVIPGKPPQYMLDGVVKVAQGADLQGVVEAYEKKWKPGDTAIYKWTGETMEVVSTAKWPYILLKDKYGHMQTKNTDQLVTAEEYETLKAEQAARLGKKPRKPPRLAKEVEQPIEHVLRDIFYGTLTREHVPIRTGYRSLWRLELPKILKLTTRDEQESAAKEFAMSIVQDYHAEREARKERFRRPPDRRRWRERAELPGPPGVFVPPRIPPGWEPVKGGYLVNGKFIPEEEAPEMLRKEEEARAPPPERIALTGFVRRRCPHEDHQDPEWVKAHAEVEEEYPEGNFMANVEEERAAHCLPCPGYFRNRRFLKYCPFHRHKLWGVWVTTLNHWIEVYMWMFKVSGARQGLDPGVVKGCDLSPADYDKPVDWHPPGAVLKYWRDIGWAIPAKIEEAWRETGFNYKEYERLWEKIKREKPPE